MARAMTRPSDLKRYIRHSRTSQCCLTLTSMARILCQTLLRHLTPYRCSSLAVKSLLFEIPLCSHRGYSSSFKPQFIEINLGSTSSSSTFPESGGGLEAEGEEETMLIKKLEEIVHRVMLQKSTPDWLPFVPGSSFWVPPHKRPFSVKQLADKLTDKLSDEESFSLTSARGWPCFSFYISPQGSAAVEVEVTEEGDGGMKRQVWAGLDSENGEVTVQVLAGSDLEDGEVPVQVLADINSGDGDAPVQVLLGSDLEDGVVPVQVLEGSDLEEG